MKIDENANMINKRRVERTKMVDKQTNQERKKTPATIDECNVTCSKIGDSTFNRSNQDTLSAMEEGRRIAADDHVLGYRTMDELKAALEK